METRTMSTDWKTQHSKDTNPLQINTQVLCNSCEDSAYTLTRLFQNLYGTKEIRIAKTVFFKFTLKHFFYKKNKVGGMSLPDFET